MSVRLSVFFVFDTFRFDRGTELKICLTTPPMWAKEIATSFGDITEHTLTGQRLVAEDAKTQLIVISPFLDVGIMQVVLKDIYAKTAELIVVTSDPALVRQYPSGRNYKLEKLRALIKSRFRAGKVFFVGCESSIAHAKVWCSDKSLLVTSANIKPDSTADNLEIGLYTDAPELVTTVNELVEHILKMEGILCLMEVPL